MTGKIVKREVGKVKKKEIRRYLEMKETKTGSNTRTRGKRWKGKKINKASKWKRKDRE